MLLVLLLLLLLSVKTDTAVGVVFPRGGRVSLSLLLLLLLSVKTYGAVVVFPRRQRFCRLREERRRGVDVDKCRRRRRRRFILRR